MGVVRLEAYPSRVLLDRPAASQRLLVTGVTADGRTIDLSDRVRLRSSAPRIATVQGGSIHAAANGFATVRVELPGAKLTAVAPVEVRRAQEPIRYSFSQDILPLLTKAGCSSGGCHGKSTGQNGFRLSLLGFDPEADYVALVRQPVGRRVCLTEPENSLLLRKASGGSPHGGGKRFDRASAAYRTLLAWVEAGAPMGPSDAPTVSQIEIFPPDRELTRRSGQRFVVTARYTDGSTRDVTADADYLSNEESVAEVDPTGRARTLDLTGEATVMARYMGRVAVSRLLVPASGPAPPSALRPDDGPIDRRVFSRLDRLRIGASDPCSDEEFLRRATLDVIGCLPTVTETRSFLQECRAESAAGQPALRSRSALIERLLARPEYADFWAVQWADVLRVNRSTLGTDQNAQSYHRWIRESFAANKPFDQFLREIVTATGPGWTNGAVNFYRVAFESPTAAAEVTTALSQTFLGTRIECAQCHHHPYEKWSQEDFYGLAAFFGRLKNKRSKEGDIEYFSDAAGDVKHPRTNKPVTPRVLDGPMVSVPRGEDPRSVLASWLTAKDNPFVARALVNRLWAHYMGRGLVEPIDDLRVTNPATNPELLDFLAQEFIGHGFDLKYVTRLILTSRVYGLSSRVTPSNKADTQNFSHAYLKRLSAETLLDAICQVTGVPESFAGLPAGTRAMQLWNNRTPSYFLDTFGRPLRVSPCECERSAEPNVAQALHLINSPQLQEKLASDRGKVAEFARSVKTPEELVEGIYLSALSRAPKPAERAAAVTYLKRIPDRRRALEDFLWSLLNTREFLFNH